MGKKKKPLVKQPQTRFMKNQSVLTPPDEAVASENLRSKKEGVNVSSTPGLLEKVIQEAGLNGVSSPVECGFNKEVSYVPTVSPVSEISLSSIGVSADNLVGSGDGSNPISNAESVDSSVEPVHVHGAGTVRRKVGFNTAGYSTMERSEKLKILKQLRESVRAGHCFPVGFSVKTPVDDTSFTGDTSSEYFRSHVEMNVPESVLNEEAARFSKSSQCKPLDNPDGHLDGAQNFDITSSDQNHPMIAAQYDPLDQTIDDRVYDFVEPTINSSLDPINNSTASIGLGSGNGPAEVNDVGLQYVVPVPIGPDLQKLHVGSDIMVAELNTKPNNIGLNHVSTVPVGPEISASGNPIDTFRFDGSSKIGLAHSIGLNIPMDQKNSIQASLFSSGPSMTNVGHTSDGPKITAKDPDGLITKGCATGATARPTFLVQNL